MEVVAVADVAATVSSWRADGRQVAIARPVSFAGFSSRRPEEMLALNEAGHQAGGILGRSITDDVAERLGVLLRADGPVSQLVRLPVSAEAAAGAGLACGGTVTLALHRTDAIPEAFWSAIVDRRPVALASVVDAPSSATGAAGVLAVTGADDPEAESSGTLPDPGLTEQAVAAARKLLAAGRTASTVIEADDRTLVVEAVVPAVHLLVVGSGDLAAALARQADLLGWRFMAFDDAESATTAVASSGRGDGVVVLSHDPAVDTPALAAALASRAGYIGALGSRRTQAGRRERLAGLGVPDAAIAAIHGPAGLDLGARTPEEIALAIAAELLAVRAGRAATSLRERAVPINS